MKPPTTGISPTSISGPNAAWAAIVVVCLLDARQQCIGESTDGRHHDHDALRPCRVHNVSHIAKRCAVFDGRAAEFHDGWYRCHRLIALRAIIERKQKKLSLVKMN